MKLILMEFVLIRNDRKPKNSKTQFLLKQKIERIGNNYEKCAKKLTSPKQTIL